MMNKSLLKQALKFQDEKTTYSKVEKLVKDIKKYQKDNDVVFIYAMYRQKVKLLDRELFFEFVSDEIVHSSNSIKSFQDIENLLNAKTRKENIELSGDSKNSIVKVFDNVVVFQDKNNHPILYKNILDIKADSKIVAVENGETFLNIYEIMSNFGYTQFIYLGGFSNTLTRDFLKDKDVLFFLDYDIEAIRIYDSFKCKKKSFFKHPKIESYFDNKSFLNVELYKKQREKLPDFHSELQWLIKLIKDKSGVIEQEIII